MVAPLWVSMPIIRNIVLGSGCNSREIEVMCESGGITAEQLNDTDYKLSLEQNCAIMEAALTLSNNKTLGLHIGVKTTAVVLGITGHLMQSSKDVLSALQNLQHFTPAFTRLYNFYLEEKGMAVHYYCEPLEVWNHLSPETARQSVDLAYAGAINILYLLTGKRIYPEEVWYRYPKPADIGEYEKVFNCSPSFNKPNNCIVFSRTDMAIPVVGYNHELSIVFKTLLESELNKQQTGRFSDEVKRILLRLFEFSLPQLEEVAGYLHITSRTLQRKLKEENTSFRVLSDEVRVELARNLLSKENLSVAEIAHKLGYADSSSFNRAFRQWMGVSPAAYRQQP